MTGRIHSVKWADGPHGPGKMTGLVVSAVIMAVGSLTGDAAISLDEISPEEAGLVRDAKVTVVTDAGEEEVTVAALVDHLLDY